MGMGGNGNVESHSRTSIVGMTVLVLSHDHPLAKGVHNVDQATATVDPEIPHVGNLLDQWIGSLGVGSHPVDHKDLETVDIVYLVTGIDPVPGNVVLATVDADQVLGWKPRAGDWKRPFTCGL